MDQARADEVEGLDEEFLFHLNRGAETLAHGEPAPARESLEKALELRPRDSKALGLLGQAFYKMGRFEEAAEAYGRLVDENPVEAAARVNLGLANLKARRHAEAVKHLEVALDLSPGHKKAMGYLGLACLETGDFARAREWFLKAGSAQMVARCDELIQLAQPMTGPLPAAAPLATTTMPGTPAAAETATAPSAAGTPGGTAMPTAVGFPAVASPPTATSTHAAADGGTATAIPVHAAPPSASPFAPLPTIPVTEVLPVQPPAPAFEPEPPAAALPPPAAPLAGVPTLAQLAESRLVVPAAVETFAVSRGLLTVTVRGDVLVRARGLASVRGAVKLTAEMKRFRGKATDKPFGEGVDQVLRASGEGALLFRAGPRRLTPVELSGESGYFREEVVFGFEDALAFENGRVASRLGSDLNLVHLRGRGRFLLATAGELTGLQVSADAPLRVPLPALAGWSGGLTPRLAPLQEGAEGAEAALVVELSGEGRVLLDPEAAQGAASQA